MILVGARFGPSTLDEQGPVGPIGLEIDSADEIIAQEEGKNVVAVPAFRDRGVDLDPVMEPEYPLRPLSVPDDRVEGAEQGAGADSGPVDAACLLQAATRTTVARDAAYSGAFAIALI